MTSHRPATGTVLGSLRAEDGKAVVGMEDLFDTDLDDLWSTLTGHPDQTVIEATLSPAGDQARLVVEERGLPLSEAAAGWQAHLEDLAAHLTGQPTMDWYTRWTDLTPTDQAQQAHLG